MTVVLIHGQLAYTAGFLCSVALPVLNFFRVPPIHARGLDSNRQLYTPPAQVDSLGGMVVLGILAHYGFHINVQTDRFLSWVLDALPCPSQQLLDDLFGAASASPFFT